MIAPARIAAYETVLAVAAGRADLPAALAHARGRLGDERDRALAGEIATGTLRWQGAFDHVIAQFAGRPVARLDPEIVAILRTGMFQLLHLDRVPAAAVVDDAVNLARKAGKKSAAGFVNALLRRVSRERARLPIPEAPPIDVLSVSLSHPRWLSARWLERHGFDAAARWARFDNSPAPLTLRVNTLKTTAEALVRDLAEAGVATEPGRFAPNALVVTGGNPLLTPLAHGGAFVVQDEASQLVGEYVDAAGGETILDACASPGGKTTQMAAAMGGRGTIVAADVRGRRVDLLARTVAQSGARNIRVIQADARAVPAGPAAFDAVLLDAPCSGLGIIRRDPDVRWRRTEGDLAVFAERQREMLDSLAAVVRPGGRIVYSTCSSEPDENAAVVGGFLSAHPGFRREVPPRFAASPVLAALLDGEGALETLPFRDGLEAFYAVRMVRTTGW
ncbi:MAG TPA: 16S rRNA (cytosine(967)-C(5))-methyltransferase RsmB [Vicinamibacterales bacterium]|nr:16S rRNA (cytosine(967)-C(5))-methyltransferase RsmB [Vicinamibacterales bacterium]